MWYLAPKLKLVPNMCSYNFVTFDIGGELPSAWEFLFATMQITATLRLDHFKNLLFFIMVEAFTPPPVGSGVL